MVEKKQMTFKTERKVALLIASPGHNLLYWTKKDIDIMKSYLITNLLFKDDEIVILDNEKAT